jgi:hypothetical protein
MPDCSAEKSGFQMNANPFATEFSGKAGSGVPSVKILMARIVAKIKSNGIAIFANFSMPFEIPLYSIAKFNANVTNIKPYTGQIELNV